MSAATLIRPCAIWHNGALGDLLISFPSMNLLKNAFGDISIFIARGEAGRFVGRLLGAGSFLSADSPDLISIFSGHVPRPLNGIGRVVLFTNRPQGDLASALSTLFEDTLHVINTSPGGKGRYGHSLYEQQYAQARSLTGEYGDMMEHLPGRNKKEPGDYWVLHPGSGGMEKNWPVARFKALIKGVRRVFPAFGVRVIIGPAEGKRAGEIAALLEMDGVGGIIGAPLEMVFEILGGAVCYVGNDSGISHLAALARTRSFIIFGPTDPATWAPPFPWVQVIAKREPGPVDAIQVNAVLARVLKTISR